MSSSHHSSQAAAAAAATTDAEAVINAPVKLLLEDSDLCLDGSVTITKTTLVVFKTDSPVQSEEPLFLGVSSIPLLQFYRHNEMLTLLRGGGLLFDNASPSAGLQENNTTTDHKNNAAAVNPPLPHGSTLNKPTMWEKLTLQFDNTAACSRVVAVLRRRHAEELQTPPLPVAESSLSSDEELIELSSNRRSPRSQQEQEQKQAQPSQPLSRADGAGTRTGTTRTATTTSSLHSPSQRATPLTASALHARQAAQSNGHGSRLTSATNSSPRHTTNTTSTTTHTSHAKPQESRREGIAASESRSATTTEQSRREANPPFARSAATPSSHLHSSRNTHPSEPKGTSEVYSSQRSQLAPTAAAIASAHAAHENEDEVPRYSASHRSSHTAASSAAAARHIEDAVEASVSSRHSHHAASHTGGRSDVATGESTPRDITRERLQLHLSHLPRPRAASGGSLRSSRRDEAGSLAEGQAEEEHASSTHGSRAKTHTTTTATSVKESKSHSARRAHSSRDGSTRASSVSSRPSSRHSHDHYSSGENDVGSGPLATNTSASAKPTPYTRIDLSNSGPGSSMQPLSAMQSALSGPTASTSSRLTRETPAAVPPALHTTATNAAAHDSLASTHTTNQSAARSNPLVDRSGYTPVTSHMTRHTSEMASARSMSSHGSSRHTREESEREERTGDAAAAHSRASHTPSSHGLAAPRAGSSHRTHSSHTASSYATHTSSARGGAASATPSSPASSASVPRSERSSRSAARSSQSQHSHSGASALAARAEVASSHASLSSSARARRRTAAAAPPAMEREYRPGAEEARRLLAESSHSASHRSASASQSHSRPSSASPGRSSSAHSAAAYAESNKALASTRLSSRRAAPISSAHPSSHVSSRYNNVTMGEQRGSESDSGSDSGSAEEQEKATPQAQPRVPESALAPSASSHADSHRHTPRLNEERVTPAVVAAAASARAASSSSHPHPHPHPHHRRHSSSRHGSSRRSRSSNSGMSSSSSMSSVSQPVVPQARRNQTPGSTTLMTTPSVVAGSSSSAAAIVRAHSATSSYRAAATHTPMPQAARQPQPALQDATAYPVSAAPAQAMRGGSERSHPSQGSGYSARQLHHHSALGSEASGSAGQMIAQLQAELRSARGDNAALQLLLRSAQKLQHHRLHLIQYLHKELVHQAYLVEVGKFITATAAAEALAAAAAGNALTPTATITTTTTPANATHTSRSTSHRRHRRRTQSASVSLNRPHRQTLSSHSHTPRSTAFGAKEDGDAEGAGVAPRASRAETGALEAARLQELERRLAEIEALHAEAQRDRDEAARLRRDCEAKQDELALRLSSVNGGLPPQQQTGTINAAPRGGSRPNSELAGSSTLYTPKRASMANLNVNTAPGYTGAVSNYYNNNNNSLTSNGSPVAYNASANAVLKAGGNVGSRRGSTAAGYSLAVVAPPSHSEVAKYIDLHAAAAAQAQRVQRIVEADLTSAVIDRYVFGGEWAKLYPVAEVDVRFCAQIDLCLALQLPRRQVIVTGLAVDQPGLRVTLEVRYEPGKLPREVIERRVAGCPCRFLQRLYDMRDLFPGQGGVAAAAGRLPATTATPHTKHGRRGSNGSLAASSSLSPALSSRQRHASHPRHRPYADGDEDAGRDDGGAEEDDVTSLSADEWLSHQSYASTERNGRHRSPARYAAARRAELDRRMRERVEAAEAHLAHKRERLARALKLQVQQYLIELEDGENYARESLVLDEAKQRQALHHAAHRHLRATAEQAMSELQSSETVARAALEVGAARQLQALTASHRRHEARLLLHRYERERRDRVTEQEAYERENLRGVMLDTLARAWQEQGRITRDAQRPALPTGEDGGAEGGEGLRGEAQNLLEKLRRTQSSIGGRLAGPAAGLLRELDVEERLDRAAITSAAMSDWVTLMYNAATAAAQTTPVRATPSSAASTSLPALATRLRACQREEAAERDALAAEQARRRNLYAREYVVMREIFDRDAVERDAYAGHDALTDDFLARHRAELERRLRSREALQGLLQSEQFYRDTILSDEQDGMELITELFATGLADILARLQAQQRPKTPPTDDDVDYLRHRPLPSPRVAKPFHYMTFSPEDMDYGPSAALALEAILGCSINKNLEVVSISRPLPKATEEELQFQAADMILDVAGFSLHSLSHLREVLSARAMQIQSEAREEFPELGEEEYTTNPALQKYIEMLCEHHNFLVQVLRGCDIYQIIVRS